MALWGTKDSVYADGTIAVNFSPNSASSGILFTASLIIFDANGSKNDNIILMRNYYTI